MRIGIIGCGEIGSLRAAALKRLSVWRLQAVSDIDRTRGSALSQRFGAGLESNWRSLVERKDLDAVLVCTPPHLHAEMCIEALSAGKHVLCEKPLARSSEECRGILEVANKNRRFLATGFNYRFFPSIQKARKLLDSGLIGALDHIQSYAGYSAADQDHPWIHNVEVTGGGALRDNGIHLIDLTRYFLGEITEAQGIATNSVWGFQGCEDNGFLLMRSAAGRTASLHASWTEWRKYRFVIEIYASRGCIRASCFPMLTTAIWREAGNRGTHRRTHWFPGVHLMEHFHSYRWVAIQSFVRELQDFSEAIQGHTATLATGFDGMRAIEIAESASRHFKTLSC